MRSTQPDQAGTDATEATEAWTTTGEVPAGAWTSIQRDAHDRQQRQQATADALVAAGHLAAPPWLTDAADTVDADDQTAAPGPGRAPMSHVDDNLVEDGGTGADTPPGWTPWRPPGGPSGPAARAAYGIGPMNGSGVCAGCGGPLPPLRSKGNPRRWCSESCRVRAWRRSNRHRSWGQTEPASPAGKEGR